jgi:hypothetical protein
MMQTTTPHPNPAPTTAPAAPATPLSARPQADPGDAEFRAWRASMSAMEANLRSTLSTSLRPPREHARLTALAKAARCAHDVLAEAAP